MRRLAPIRLPLALTLACAALAGVVLFQTRPAPTPEPRPRPAVEAEAEADGGDARERAGGGFEMGDEQAYSELVERPLFNRSRRPVPVEAVAGAGAGAAGPETTVPFQLSGVVVTGATRVALFRYPNTTKVVRAEEGEIIDGWRIESIDARKVVVRSGEGRKDMELADRLLPPSTRPIPGKKAAGPPPGRQPAARPPGGGQPPP